MDCSMPGFPVLHYFPEPAHTKVQKSVMPSTISYSAVPFSFCLQSFPASGSFPMNQLFTSGGQSIRASASASILPMNIQGWYSLGLTGLISLLSKGLLWSSPGPQFQSINSLALSLLYGPTLTPLLDYCKKVHSFDYIQTFVGKVMSVLFNTLSGFVIAFLPRSKHLLISWLQYHLHWSWSPRK